MLDCDALLAECDENEMRKNFVTSERVAIATAMIPKYEGRNHRPSNSDKCGNISTLIEEGKSRDIVAAKVGLRIINP